MTYHFTHNFIPEADLIHGRVYRTRSRNLVIGVWNANTRGFIGLREKFKSRYLFTEFHHDADPHFGTAQAVTDLGMDVPDDQIDESSKELFALLDEHEPAVLETIQAEYAQAEIDRESLKWKPLTEVETRHAVARAEVDAWLQEQKDSGRRYSDFRDEFIERMQAAGAILKEAK